jgi:uncharacterized protein YjbI with pentapeptide repeats
VRRVILIIEAIGAIAFAAGSIKYERYVYVGAAWAFGALPLVYALLGAVRNRQSRLVRIGAVLILLPSLGLSTLVVTQACSNRLSPGSNLSGCDFSGVSLAGVDLHGANLSGAKLARTDLSKANLRGATLNEADLTGANLTGSFLNGASMAGAHLQKVALRGAALEEANLSGADLRGLDLIGRDLSRLTLSGADLRGADLSGSNLSLANLDGAKLAQAKLAGATLDEAKLSRATADGADLSGATLERASLDGVSLKGADLSSAAMTGANLQGASLVGAHLADAQLSDANLAGANLAGADLSNATLNGTTLDGARLESTELSNADLSGATLEGVVLRDVVLDGATLIGATGLPDADLAQGLGVSEATLAETLISRQIRLEERSAILRTLGLACRGRGVAEAHSFGGTGLHPLALVGGRGGTSPLGGKAAQLNWEPMAVRFGQLVACVEEEDRITVELCSYFDAATGAPGPPTRRVRFRRRVRLIEASTTRVLFDQTYEGTFPHECPFTKTSFGSFGEDVIAGSHVGFARFRTQLAGYVR